MLVALHNGNITSLAVAGLVSSLGDWLLIIGLPFFVFQITGSTLATGTTFVIEMAPGLVIGTFAGALVDQWDRRYTMIVADLSRALLLLPLLLFHSADEMGIVYGVALGLSVVSHFFGPAKGALLPGLVADTDLAAANSVLGIGDEVAMLVGAPLGGVLLAILGLSGLVLLDAASFVLSAVLIAGIRTASPGPGANTPSLAVQRGRWWQICDDVCAGLGVIRANGVVGTILACRTLEALGQGLITVLWVVFFETVLHGNALGYGAVQTALALGTITGGLLVGTVGQSLPVRVGVGMSGVAVGILLLATFNVPFLAPLLGLHDPLLPLVFILQAVMGLPAMWSTVLRKTLLQESVEDAFRGRMLGASATLASLGVLLGSTFASLFGDHFGPLVLLDVAGALYAVSGGVALILLGSIAAHHAGARGTMQNETQT